jgi:hypothetical protein
MYRVARGALTNKPYRGLQTVSRLYSSSKPAPPPVGRAPESSNSSFDINNENQFPPEYVTLEWEEHFKPLASQFSKVDHVKFLYLLASTRTLEKSLE